MFEKTVGVERTWDNFYKLPQMCDPELDKIYSKHNGFMTVRISVPIESKTLKQLATAHALISAFYLSGMASLPENCTLAKFKLLKKVEYGVCFETEYKGQLVRVPISMADYSKDEMREFIDKLLVEIKQSGAESDKKVQEIIFGMEAEKLSTGH
jgi:hypothetical protein